MVSEMRAQRRTRVPPGRCISPQRRRLHGSSRGFRLRNSPPQLARGLPQLFRGTALFPRFRPFPQAASPRAARRAPLRRANPPPKPEAPVPAPCRRGCCNEPGRGWLGTGTQMDRAVCSEATRDVGLRQGRSRHSVSQRSGSAQRVSPLHTSSPSW